MSDEQTPPEEDHPEYEEEDRYDDLPLDDSVDPDFEAEEAEEVVTDE